MSRFLRAAEQIHLHHVGQELGLFIHAFGERVLPELRA
jgi:hypothetical protein